MLLFLRVSSENMWLCQSRPDLVKERLKSSKQGIRVNEQFLGQFYDWARVELTNRYNQVRMTKDQLSDPIAPPDDTVHLFLVVQRFGLKWNYMKYQSLILSLIHI